MNKRNLVLLAAFLIGSVLYGQRLSRQEYIDQYQHIAIREMKRAGVPASIILGQGILESDGGNSDLAVKKPIIILGSNVGANGLVRPLKRKMMIKMPLA